MRGKNFLCWAAVLSSFLGSLKAQTPSSSNQKSSFEDWNQPFEPFRIVGNVHYVGTNNLACFLITTSAGHVLIDTGLEESAPIVRANIATLGFRLKDIKIILSGHAHFDHVAGHAAMKQATGARVYATAADAAILESGGTKGFHPLTPYPPVKVDRILRDGEVVRLGDQALTAHLTPGHTDGNTTWTTTVKENGKEYRVVFVASMSINPGVHLVDYPPWPTIAEAYAESFQRLKSLPCDVFLGPHAPFFDLEAKVGRMKAKTDPNPFVDPQGYRDYLASFEKSYHEQLQRERAGK
ncbi:MAG: subclass B3 metallo-beta-lactamase [Ferruginibacter sp.]|nr:subclass B3 metallo-beta-lactamase [Cytophagales bacterium]